jgi:hypothetical protein
MQNEEKNAACSPTGPLPSFCVLHSDFCISHVAPPTATIRIAHFSISTNLHRHRQKCRGDDVGWAYSPTDRTQANWWASAPTNISATHLFQGILVAVTYFELFRKQVTVTN